MENHEKTRLVFLFDAISNTFGMNFLDNLEEYLVRGKRHGFCHDTHTKPMLSKVQFDETVELAKKVEMISVDESGRVIVLKSLEQVLKGEGK